jgi:hypothetical protein
MTIDAMAGPAITYGITVSASGGQGEYNEHRGPSLNDLGSGMLDPRAQYGYGYQPGQSATQPTFGFWGQTAIVDYIPGTISSNNIATTQVPTNGTALTLTASGVTVTAVSCIIAPETGKLITGTLLCIDTPCGGSTAAGISFGSANSIQIWNPASVCGRCISIAGSSQNDGGINWSIAGRDVYGFKVTETVAGTTGGSTTAGATGGVPVISKKAYKYITSITPVNSTGTLASTNVVVGTADTYGFPFLLQHPGYVTIWTGATSSAALVTLSSGAHVYGSSLPTATSTNGDVRGTYVSSVASSTSGGMRILMIQNPMIGVADAALSSYSGFNNISPTNNYNLFGAAQFSSV